MAVSERFKTKLAWAVRQSIALLLSSIVSFYIPVARDNLPAKVLIGVNAVVVAEQTLGKTLHSAWYVGWGCLLGSLFSFVAMELLGKSHGALFFSFVVLSFMWTYADVDPHMKKFALMNGTISLHEYYDKPEADRMFPFLVACSTEVGNLCAICAVLCPLPYRSPWATVLAKQKVLDVTSMLSAEFRIAVVQLTTFAAIVSTEMDLRRKLLEESAMSQSGLGEGDGEGEDPGGSEWSRASGSGARGSIPLTHASLHGSSNHFGAASVRGIQSRSFDLLPPPPRTAEADVPTRSRPSRSFEQGRRAESVPSGLDLRSPPHDPPPSPPPPTRAPASFVASYATEASVVSQPTEPGKSALVSVGDETRDIAGGDVADKGDGVDAIARPEVSLSSHGAADVSSQQVAEGGALPVDRAAAEAEHPQGNPSADLADGSGSFNFGRHPTRAEQERIGGSQDIPSHVGGQASALTGGGKGGGAAAEVDGAHGEGPGPVVEAVSAPGPAPGATGRQMPLAGPREGGPIVETATPATTATDSHGYTHTIAWVGETPRRADAEAAARPNGGSTGVAFEDMVERIDRAAEGQEVADGGDGGAGGGGEATDAGTAPPRPGASEDRRAARRASDPGSVGSEEGSIDRAVLAEQRAVFGAMYQRLKRERTKLFSHLKELSHQIDWELGFLWSGTSSRDLTDLIARITVFQDHVDGTYTALARLADADSNVAPVLMLFMKHMWQPMERCVTWTDFSLRVVAATVTRSPGQVPGCPDNNDLSTSLPPPKDLHGDQLLRWGMSMAVTGLRTAYGGYDTALTKARGELVMMEGDTLEQVRSGGSDINRVLSYDSLAAGSTSDRGARLSMNDLFGHEVTPLPTSVTYFCFCQRNAVLSVVKMLETFHVLDNNRRNSDSSMHGGSPGVATSASVLGSPPPPRRERSSVRAGRQSVRNYVIRRTNSPAIKARKLEVTLRFDRIRMRNSFKVLLAMVIAAVVSYSVWPELSGYAPITVAFIQGGHMGGAFAQSVLRVQGTVFGGLMAYFILEGVRNTLWANAVGHSLWGLLSGYVRSDPSSGYSGVVSAFTASLIMLGWPETDGVQDGEFDSGELRWYTMNRLTHTFIGISSFIIIEMTLWPSRSSTLARREMAAVLNNIRKCLMGDFEAYITVGCMHCKLRALAEVQVLMKEIAKRLAYQKVLEKESKLEPVLWLPPFSAELHNRMAEVEGRLIVGLKEVRSALLGLYADEWNSGEEVLAQSQGDADDDGLGNVVQINMWWTKALVERLFHPFQALELSIIAALDGVIRSLTSAIPGDLQTLVRDMKIAYSALEAQWGDLHRTLRAVHAEQGSSSPIIPNQPLLSFMAVIFTSETIIRDIEDLADASTRLQHTERPFSLASFRSTEIEGREMVAAVVGELVTALHKEKVGKRGGRRTDSKSDRPVEARGVLGVHKIVRSITAAREWQRRSLGKVSDSSVGGSLHNANHAHHAGLHEQMAHARRVAQHEGDHELANRLDPERCSGRCNTDQIADCSSRLELGRSTRTVGDGRGRRIGQRGAQSAGNIVDMGGGLHGRGALGSEGGAAPLVRYDLATDTLTAGPGHRRGRSDGSNI